MNELMRVALLAADPDAGGAGPTLDSSGVVEWTVKNLIPLLLLGLGLAIIAGARKGRISENAGIVTNIVIGCGVIAGAAVLYGFSGTIVDLAFGGS